MRQSHEYRVWKTLMRSTKDGCVPDGYYGPETCRWATPEETMRFGLTKPPLVHLDRAGNIDCYFTESKAIVVASLN